MRRERGLVTHLTSSMFFFLFLSISLSFLSPGSSRSGRRSINGPSPGLGGATSDRRCDCKVRLAAGDLNNWRVCRLHILLGNMVGDFCMCSPPPESVKKEWPVVNGKDPKQIIPLNLHPPGQCPGGSLLRLRCDNTLVTQSHGSRSYPGEPGHRPVGAWLPTEESVYI